MDAKKVIGTVVGITIVGCGLAKTLSRKEPPKYSSKWMKTVSEEVLRAERENVMIQCCNAGYDFSLADSLRRIMLRIDEELHKRTWDGTEYIYPKHGEHGCHLLSDD